MITIKEVVEKAELLQQDRDQIPNLLRFLSDKKLAQFNDARLYRIKGQTFIKKSGPRMQNVKEAIKYFSEAINIEPVDASLYCERANAYRRAGNLQMAMEDCEQAIFCNPALALAYLERAKVWRARKKYAEMKKDLERAVLINPKDPKPYYLRSDFWRFMHARTFPRRMENSFKDLETAVRFDNKSPARAHMRLGRHYFDEHKYEQAFENYSKAINKDPSIDNWEMDMFIYVYSALSVDKRQREKIYNVCAPAYELLSEIKWMYLSNYDSSETSIVHYTKLSVADILFSSDDNKMRFFHASYMNDPEEGKVLIQIFDNKDITDSFAAAELNLESNFYIGSFLPHAHADELVMWRTYGKDEHDSEAKGCSISINRSFFAKEKLVVAKATQGSQSTAAVPKKGKKVKDNDAKSRPRFDTSLYKVIYYNRNKKKLIIPNQDRQSAELKKELLKLRTILLKIIAFKKKADNRADKLNKAIDRIVHHIITELRYYFKSADYSYENEERVILSVPPENPLVKIEDRTILPKRLYVEAKNPLRKHIKKIILGPRVVHPEQWSYLKVKMIKENFKIELKKSACKFQ